MAKTSSQAVRGATVLTLPSWPTASASCRAVSVSHTPTHWSPEAV